MLCRFFLLLATFVLLPMTSQAEIHCKMDFTLKSWSILYKSGKGIGNITCDNGQSFPIRIRAHGGGLTVGKSKVKGYGKFTPVDKISELYGRYASATAHGGIVKSGNVEGLTKGEVSLSLSGKGHGFDLGVAIGSIKISPR